MLKNRIIIILFLITTIGSIFFQYKNKLKNLKNEKKQLEIELRNSIIEMEFSRSMEAKNRENLKNLHKNISKINKKYDSKKNIDIDNISIFLNELQSRTTIQSNKNSSK